MKFTIVGNGGKFIAYIEAESSIEAEKKAKRIERSKPCTSKPCPWRGAKWYVLEYNTPFSTGANSMIKNKTRRRMRRLLNTDAELDNHSIKQLGVVGGYKVRARNGTVTYD